MRRLLIGGVVAMLVLTTACNDPARDARDDAQVLAVVLDHFANRSNTLLPETGGVVLIQAESRAVNSREVRLPDRIELGGCRGLAATHASWLVRNAQLSSLEARLPPSPLWRIATPEEAELLATPDGADLLRFRPQDSVRTLMELHLPGFDAERTRALVRFSYDAGGHPGDATYVVQRAQDGWRVACSQGFIVL